MTISERISYVKGLAEGMKLNTETGDGKIISAIIEILSDISEEIDAINEEQFDIADQLDEVDEDLANLEDIIYGDDDDECDGDCDCCDENCGDDDIYEVTCPNCNDVIYIDSEMLEEEGIACPNCGTDLEFDFDCDCESCNCECADEE